MNYKCGTGDQLLTAAGKVCRKLHMSQPIINVLSSFIKREVDMTSVEADLILEASSPEPKGTAVVQRDNNWNQNQQYDLQIIVPAYNVEEYIEECINSLLVQQSTFRWQAIIINDGSTDATAEILENYKSNPLLKIISQENRGFSGARNRGLDLVSSHYIMFLDSDDRLEPGAIENLMIYAIKKQLDIVEGNYNDWIQGKLSQASFSNESVVNDPITDLRGFPWGKVVRTELFRSLKYPENYWYEDSIFSFLIYPRCEKCGTIKDVVYSYRRNPKGVSMGSKGKTKCVDTYYIAELMVRTAVSLHISLDCIYDLLLGHILFSYQRISGLNMEIRKAVFLKFCDLHREFFENGMTANVVLEKIREAIMMKDFGLFELYCRVL